MKLLLFALCLVSVGTLPRPPLTRVPWFCLDGADKGPCNADYKRVLFPDTSSIKRQGDVKISLTVDVEETKTISGDVESV
ncbi:hypothetical protein Y032_0788g2358 [Ancylostoma ceylanicum]|uniref:Uncharacterized protein n=1 Tax=Ancylostoma ceylanicum TaxID=53326 RepID=A0A016WEM9_9BILA|nr:hypothetical protein Y032_0788g2358 [Ancylostoma ceylanicum]